MKLYRNIVRLIVVLLHLVRTIDRWEMELGELADRMDDLEGTVERLETRGMEDIEEEIETRIATGLSDCLRDAAISIKPY